MSRLLLLVAIAAVVHLLLRSFRKGAPQGGPELGDMVRCAQCGVHLPIHESIEAGGHLFCSAEHRDAYRK